MISPIAGISGGTLIRVENLTKKYAATVAVDGISFEINKNEIVGFLGPNGAGKSTTLKVLTCFHAASGGVVEIGGKDVFTDPEGVKTHIGYLPENVPLYPEMRVSEYLGYRAGLKGMRGKMRRDAVDNVVGRCRLDGVRDRIIGQLSKGYRQRVGLADALVADPDILILDEPTIGLDPGQIRDVRELIKELGRERTVILSSHILPEVEAVCSRIIIINKGKIVGSGQPQELREQLQAHGMVVDLEVRDKGDKCASFLSSLDGVSEVTTGAESEGVKHFTVHTAGAVDVREAIFEGAVKEGFKLLGMSRKSHSLEDVFVDIITNEDAPVPAPADADGEVTP